MPLTKFQTALAKLLTVNRTPDSYLAGGAALNLSPHSKRFSYDLDYFHDSVERVAQAYSDDLALLTQNGYDFQLELKQPGYIRGVVSKGGDHTKIEWAHDSAWRFMPPVENQTSGYQLHPIDLAINKVLALASRDEARDFLDILYVHREILPLGALCWAAVGKDAGFTPLSLLELLKRRGRYRPEDFARLELTEPIELPRLKATWLEALAEAERFIRSDPYSEIGCLFFSKSKGSFVQPTIKWQSTEWAADIVPHFGHLGGIAPAF